MSNKDVTEIIFLIDKSGSMGGLVDDTIGGYNSFIENQRQQPGEARVTVILFDTMVDVIADGVPIDKAPLLTRQNYQPSGMTSLLDAIGVGIHRTIERITKMKKANKPGTTIMVITTDGAENSSREYSRELVFNKIKEQKEKHNWQFLFLGANQDAIATASHIGIGANAAVTFDASSRGVTAMYSAVSSAVSQYRGAGGQSVTMSFSMADEYKNAYNATATTHDTTTTTTSTATTSDGNV